MIFDRWLLMMIFDGWLAIDNFKFGDSANDSHYIAVNRWLCV